MMKFFDERSIIGNIHLLQLILLPLFSWVLLLLPIDLYSKVLRLSGVCNVQTQCLCVFAFLSPCRHLFTAGLLLLLHDIFISFFKSILITPQLFHSKSHVWVLCMDCAYHFQGSSICVWASIRPQARISSVWFYTTKPARATKHNKSRYQLSWFQCGSTLPNLIEQQSTRASIRYKLAWVRCGSTLPNLLAWWSPWWAKHCIEVTIGSEESFVGVLDRLK